MMLQNMSEFLQSLLGGVSSFLGSEPMIYFVTVGLVTFTLNAFNVIRKN